MNHRSIWTAGGLAALALLLVALPGPSQTPQSQHDASLARLQEKLADLQARLEARFVGPQEELGVHTQLLAALSAQRATQRIQENLDELAPLADQDAYRDDMTVLTLGDGTSWLGVETRDVSADTVKELKLPAERGVVLGHITPDSPAAKAGLKENDVVTEINGQRVEGALQFRRMIHEIPTGRSVQLTVWRDGHSQTIGVTLGKAEEHAKAWTRAFPSGNFSFQMPEFPTIDFYGELFPPNRARLGIDGEDLSGQLGNYFGAPDGEGVLVRGVSPGTAAEKAGLKAGDVIVKFDGERIRTVGDLRTRLSGIHEEKSAKLGVLRNRSEITLDVTIEAPARPKAPKPTRRTSI